MRCYGDKPLWFSEVSPSGAVPVAEIDGRIISESNVIMQVQRRNTLFTLGSFFSS